MIFPTKTELEQLSDQGYKSCPIAKDLLSDMITPIALLSYLREISKHVFILESVEGQELLGRYTFLGYDPSLDLVAADGEVLLKDKEGNTLEAHSGIHPDKLIRRIMEERKAPLIDGLPSFTGGLVGYFGYDYISYNEPKLKLNARNDDGFQDLDLMLFDSVFVFDNLLQKVFLVTNVPLSGLNETYAEGEKKLAEMERVLQTAKRHEAPPAVSRLTSGVRELFSEEEYCAMVERAKEYIVKGDIFQVVLSNRLEADYEGDLFPVYRMLRTVNPSPYMFYFSGDEIEVAGASPETMVKLDGSTLRTFPLAGTKPRGKTAEEDIALERELLMDEKERAEHDMLVDLGRNDLGRVSSFGSVKVERHMDVLRFSHVMHLGSTVRGTLAAGLSGVDAVNAVLPAGTLSGAPKLRACEIIDELENSRRGIYGGAIGYLDFAGNLDTCIAIRLAYKKDGKIFVRSGAGIVADSVPESEYRESMSKAAAVMLSVRKAGEMKW